MSAFWAIARSHLDNEWEKREAIIKKSREITRESKKMIVTLQRYNPDEPERVKNEAAGQYKKIQSMFAQMAALVPTHEDQCKYARYLGFCVQEFMEAIIFRHFLLSARLLPFEDARSILREMTLILTAMDYMAGVLDMTGELMRYATNAATKGRQTDVQACLSLMQAIYQECVCMTPSSDAKDFYIKMDTLKSSLTKVENVAYSMAIRREEMAALGRHEPIVVPME